MEKFDVIVIGGGPAGMTAGMYTSRARLKSLLLEKAVPGGLMLLTEKLENFPGHVDGINGYELAEQLRGQAVKFGLEIRNGEVLSLVPGTGEVTVKTPKESFAALSVIIASGAGPKKLNIPGELEFTGKGVSYCATCDGAFFRGREVAVAGGGNSAVEEAVFLTRFAKKVTVIHRKPVLRADKIVQEKMFANPQVAFLGETAIEAIRGDKTVNSLQLKNAATGAPSTLAVDGVFIFIGYEPSTAFVKNTITLDENGSILTDEHLKTSADGVYACGDCRKRPLRQVVTACGEGAVAAFSAGKYVDSLKGTAYR